LDLVRGLKRGTSPLPAAAGKFTQQSILLLVALGLLNGSNYLFHVAVSRLLGPSEYGALAALLAVAMVLSVPLGVVQTVVAQRTATLRAARRHNDARVLAAETTKALVPVAGIAAFLMLVLGTPALAIFLHVDLASSALFAPYVFLTLLVSVPLGSLQGRLRFPALVGASLAGVAVRLGAGIVFVAIGLGVPGAMLATVLAQAVVLAVGMTLLGLPRAAWRAARASLGQVRGGVAVALLGLGSFWLLAEIDIALARHFLEADDAGYYSAAGLIARSLLFLAAAVSIVAFPHFAQARQVGGEEPARWLRLSLVAVGALVVAALPILILLREPVVLIAFGERYQPAESLVPLLGVAMGFLAVVNLLVFFHIAMGSKAYYLVFGGVALEAALISLFHENPEQIVLVVLAVSGLMAGLQYHAAAAICRWHPPAGEGAGGRPAFSEGSSLELSVVLPCRNAGNGLRNVLRRVTCELQEVRAHEVIVVSDGSTDGTVGIAEAFAGDRVRVIHYSEPSGKGQALRMGLSQARGRYVAFIDADGDIGPEALRPFLALMTLYEPDIVLGSKRHPLSEVYYPPLRRFLSWGYHKLARLLFRVSVRDTQTGLKLVRRDVLAKVLPRMLEKRYAFDLELLVVARRLGYRRVFEAPVRIDYQFGSQVDPKAAFRIFVDTLAIFYRRYILNTYRADGRPTEVTPRMIARNGRPDGHLRVLFLNWRDVRNPDAGGAETFTHEVARRWVESGHEVSLLTSGFPDAPRVETIDGVRIRRIGRLRTGSFHARAQRELSRLSGFDVVIDEINTIPFFTPLWKGRLPTVIALIHQLAGDVWEAEVPRPFAALGRRLEPHALRLYREVPVVTVSDSTREDLLRLGLKDVVVVPNGRDQAPEFNGLPKEASPTFLFVGRLAANKRPDHAVRAFEVIRNDLADARLWIVGRGPLEQELRQTLPAGAEMLGYLPREELYERMARAHCLLVPSVREGWGLVVIEANSVGTPAVGYDVPGIRDSIRSRETGLLAAAGDHGALGRQALEVLRDEAEFMVLCRQAIRWSANFTWQATADQLMTHVHLRTAMPDSARGFGSAEPVPSLLPSAD
jgi:glycosyltransferase involved in cell wall biosynthesis/O-antigen/teichoic acid export membrane protein